MRYVVHPLLNKMQNCFAIVKKSLTLTKHELGKSRNLVVIYQSLYRKKYDFGKKVILCFSCTGAFDLSPPLQKNIKRIVPIISFFFLQKSARETENQLSWPYLFET